MHIITNTAISLDGRISTVKNDHVRLGSHYDLQKMSEVRGQVDAILVGGQSFRNYSHPLIPNKAHIKNKNPIWNVIVSRKMNFNLSDEFLNHPGIKPLFLTDQKMDSSLNGVPVIVCNKEITPSWIVSVLKEKGIKKLLIEAGGDLIFQFLKENLVNEMYVTLCPKIIGGRGAPSLADGIGFLKNQIKNLELMDYHIQENEIFLHYRVLGG